MDVSEDELLNSGFKKEEIQKIKNNVEIYGGTLGEAIQSLAKRFLMAMCVISFCLIVFVFLVIFGRPETVYSGSIGLLCGIAVAIFVQPPVLAYKSWRYRKSVRR